MVSVLNSCPLTEALQTAAVVKLNAALPAGAEMGYFSGGFPVISAAAVTGPWLLPH